MIILIQRIDTKKQMSLDLVVLLAFALVAAKRVPACPIYI